MKNAREQLHVGTDRAEPHDRGAPPNELADNSRTGRKGPARVLVVEDEYLIAEDIAATFQEIGVDVVGPASSVPCALRLVQETPIDVALLDIWARDETVFAVADELKERNIPFAFATGLGGAEVPERFKSARMWIKPFDVQVVARELLLLCEAESS